MDNMDDRSDQFEKHRAHLVGLAYRMLAFGTRRLLSA
jgi:hypothetical protein